MSYVRPLSDVGGEDSLQIGGKAANLAKLVQAGLPVPKGFAVGLESFDKQGRLKEETVKQIPTLLDSAKLYAVRSSALSEDAEGASWAGQFETFLDTKPENVIAKIEECHNSAKKRAVAYAEDKQTGSFDIAVVVQEMLKPEYAGVLFTKDPLTGKDQLITEYVAGLGEELVSGRADPKRIVLTGADVSAPFDTKQLIDLAKNVEQLFGLPQDIEWVWAEQKIWLVQARPITVTQQVAKGYNIGEPEDLFYWGPARTKPMYMSDWLTANSLFFKMMANDPQLPTPPKSLVLYYDNKMVYLSDAADFGSWCEATFVAYKAANRLANDKAHWAETAKSLAELDGQAFELAIIEAWKATIFAEFALYGAESSIAKQLARLDAEDRQAVWGAFTVPDNSTFLARIDAELAQTKDPAAIAKKYPWIQDGYDGVVDAAESYFAARLKIVEYEDFTPTDYASKREMLIAKLKLTEDEVEALTLARELAEFMDDRKAWMMQTRRLIKRSVGDVEHGWFFDNGKEANLSAEEVEQLWERYIDFKVSSNAVNGIVASNGGRHFVNGEVVVVGSPADSIEQGKILVVPSTSPSYVPLMRKAKALITDHGGMMSHAAIVAREFNLPCIVGTKQATKVLQTGDKVILDLIKGEVNR
ncbi:MAG TPA: PEP/pyruvate-binding domain-containing protein [Candidatus Saccharimonadales bacterium]|nr:PEP/pyruvate-binding domain-containing protein [Candidatus Saccharimonadales bacterium]